MYHFTFIDEASTEEIELKAKEQQENDTQTADDESKDATNLLTRTAHFLQENLDRSNFFRSFINKN